MICMKLVSKTQQASAKLAPEEWKTITGSADLAQLDALNALMDSAKFAIKAMRWMLMVCAQWAALSLILTVDDVLEQHVMIVIQAMNCLVIDALRVVLQVLFAKIAQPN